MVTVHPRQPWLSLPLLNRYQLKRMNPSPSRHQTSVDDSASNLSELEISTLLQIQSSSNSDLQGTSKAGKQTSIDRTLLPWLVTKGLCYKMTLFVV